jgi:hypothetical protein
VIEHKYAIEGSTQIDFDHIAPDKRCILQALKCVLRNILVGGAMAIKLG